MKIRIRSILTVGAAVLGLTGCNPNGPKADAEKTANLVYVNWAEGVAYTHLAEAVLRDKMGFEVELTAADVAPGYVAVAHGKP